MSRRYLSVDEAKFALQRGKEVEIFLGGFEWSGLKCIRWASFVFIDKDFVGKLWEVIDEGSENFLDIYSFSPISGEWEPIKEATSSEFEKVLEMFDCPNNRLVNSGVLQDEYSDYLASKV